MSFQKRGEEEEEEGDFLHLWWRQEKRERREREKGSPSSSSSSFSLFSFLPEFLSLLLLLFFHQPRVLFRGKGKWESCLLLPFFPEGGGGGGKEGRELEARRIRGKGDKYFYGRRTTWGEREKEKKALALFTQKNGTHTKITTVK